MYYENKCLKKLERVFDQNERKNYLRLDLNENPGGLPVNLIKKIIKSITPQLIAQYPETLEFSKILAKYLKTDISHICLVNGSAEGIRYIIQAFTSPKGRIVGVVPSYFMFQVYSKMYDRTFVGIPYEANLSFNVDNLIKEINDKTQLLILLNPNNPVGNAYTKKNFFRIISAAKKHNVTVLIDEAYYYFYNKTFIEYALKYDHIFVTRTFSKLCSLAGLRLGYIVGSKEGIKLVQKLCTPHNVNSIALLFAQYLIEHPKEIEKLKYKFNIGKNYLIDFLNKYKFKYNGKEGNFIFIKTNKNVDYIVKKMRDKKILVKSYKNIGKMGDCLRVSIGEKKYMKLFCDALLEIDK